MSRLFVRAFGVGISAFAIVGAFARHSELPILPDSRLTPGAVLNVTVADICAPGYAPKARNVPTELKRRVYAEYGMQSHTARRFEIDHLVPLELGGSNAITNLWPQSYLTQPWNAHVKDRVEARLHELVCTGQLALPDAQRAIATNWIAAYQRYVGAQQRKTRTAVRQRAAERPAPVASDADVWVNTRSGTYWAPGTKWYGRTKEGRYMSESDAIAAGYHPAPSH